MLGGLGLRVGKLFFNRFLGGLNGLFLHLVELGMAASHFKVAAKKVVYSNLLIRQ